MVDAPAAVKTFIKMVKDHDLTFSYSDDSNSYRRGAESLEALEAFAAANLSREKVVEIWNANVDLRISPGYRDPFYWK